MIVQPQQVIQNNYGFSMAFELEDANGDAQDLTGATVSINVQDSQDPDSELSFSGTLILDIPTAGQAHYIVANGNFTTPGTFLAQIVATYSGEQVSWPPFEIVVLPALPQANN